MDRKSIAVLVVCFLVLILWYPLVVNKLYPPKPLPPGATNTVSSTFTSPSNTVATPPGPAPAAATGNAAPRSVAAKGAPEQLLEVTNANAHYTFTSLGGGLKDIELLRYPETTLTRVEKKHATNRVATLNALTPAPALALLDGETVEGDGIFTLTPTASGVHAEKTLTNGLVITKDFRLSTNYLVEASIRLENRSAQPLNLPEQQWVVGTATPLSARDNGMAVGVVWYNGAKTEDVSAGWFANRTLGCFPGTPRTEYRMATTNLVWAAAYNQFFALAVMPRTPAEGLAAWKIDLPRITGDDARFVAENAPPPQGYEAVLLYPASKLAPGQAVERHFDIFAGPKEYQTLVRIGDRFNNNIDLLMRFGWAGFVSKALLLGMNWLHETMRVSYGWAIVAITVIIKLVFWPLTRASTRSAKRMQALQPQAKAIQEKYKDDPMKAQRKMMELWKEHKVSPMSGCLPMLIQIPVFFGFYQMIQSAIELRGASFLWVADLSQSDTLFIIPGLGGIPIFGIPGVGLPFNLLPLIMGATMLWQARLTPPSPGMDPAQAKMLRYMPLMFMVGLYSFSAGLTLYWTVNNLLTILQTKVTKTMDETATTVQAVPVTQPAKKKK